MFSVILTLNRSDSNIHICALNVGVIMEAYKRLTFQFPRRCFLSNRNPQLSRKRSKRVKNDMMLQANYRRMRFCFLSKL